jgi:hypothetical protein
MLVEDARFVNGPRMLADERAGRANRVGANRQGKTCREAAYLNMAMRRTRLTAGR